MAQLAFVATCTRGAEEVLAAELTALGLGPCTTDRGAVSFGGPLDHGYTACLWSRIASRVLLVLDRVPASDAAELFDGVASIDWREHMLPQRTFRVDFVGTSPTLRNTRFGAQVCKDAVLARFDSMAPQVDLKLPDLRLNVHLRADQAQLALDLSGEPLHLRTPGRTGGDAPLRENLAAALLHMADWPALSQAGAPLLDPMCGSGTFLAEAAGIAMDRAPGLARQKWGFNAWLGHVPQAWVRVREQAKERSTAAPDRTGQIQGADHDPSQVARSVENLARAGFPRVPVELRAVADQQPPDGPPGLWVANPPYGERIGGEDDLKALYGELGNILRRRFMGWTGWILAPDKVLASAVGLKPGRRAPVFNGAIDCRWLKFRIRAERVARDQ
jgi:23S rRNA (guanine2445-N2)-methyltransferase / 23S rRNA (guanine2069-N7)-methyltransferase